MSFLESPPQAELRGKISAARPRAKTKTTLKSTLFDVWFPSFLKPKPAFDAQRDGTFKQSHKTLIDCSIKR